MVIEKDEKARQRVRNRCHYRVDNRMRKREKKDRVRNRCFYPDGYREKEINAKRREKDRE